MGLSMLFFTVSIKFNLPLGLIDSICYVESRYDVAAIHHHDGKGDSIGICQIKLNTAKELGFKGGVKQLLNPETNIYYAAAYLKHQIVRYHSITKGVIAYNMGHAKYLTHTKYQVKVFKRWEPENECRKYADRD